MAAEVRTVTCRPEIAALAAETRNRDDGLLILPDKVRDLDGVETALFREASQELRQIGTEVSIDVEMLKPTGAVAAVQTERADAIILPIVIGIGVEAIGAVVGTYLVRLLNRWNSSGERRPQVRYRKIRYLPDGTAEQVEVNGNAEDVLEVVNAEASSDVDE